MTKTHRIYAVAGEECINNLHRDLLEMCPTVVTDLKLNNTLGLRLKIDLTEEELAYCKLTVPEINRFCAYEIE